MKGILERLVNGELNIDEAERLISADNILEFDEKKYKKDVENFLNRLGCFEKGMACKKIVDKIEKIVREN